MAKVLVLTSRGGHRATPQWTRHTPHSTDNRRMLCGFYPDPLAATDDAPGVQGYVRDCKVCAKREVR